MPMKATATVSQIEAVTEREQAFPNVESSGFSFLRPDATELVGHKSKNYSAPRSMRMAVAGKLENDAISVLFLEHASGTVREL